MMFMVAHMMEMPNSIDLWQILSDGIVYVWQMSHTPVLLQSQSKSKMSVMGIFNMASYHGPFTSTWNKMPPSQGPFY